MAVCEVTIKLVLDDVEYVGDSRGVSHEGKKLEWEIDQALTPLNLIGQPEINIRMLEMEVVEEQVVLEPASAVAKAKYELDY